MIEVYFHVLKFSLDNFDGSKHKWHYAILGHLDSIILGVIYYGEEMNYHLFKMKSYIFLFQHYSLT